jgi:hypothetical protein
MAFDNGYKIWRVMVWQWTTEESGLDFWKEQKNFLFSTASKYALVPTYIVSCPMGIGAIFREVKRPGRESDHSSLLLRPLPVHLRGVALYFLGAGQHYKSVEL